MEAAGTNAPAAGVAAVNQLALPGEPAFVQRNKVVNSEWRINLAFLPAFLDYRIIVHPHGGQA